MQRKLRGTATNLGRETRKVQCKRMNQCMRSVQARGRQDDDSRGRCSKTKSELGVGVCMHSSGRQRTSSATAVICLCCARAPTVVPNPEVHPTVCVNSSIHQSRRRHLIGLVIPSHDRNVSPNVTATSRGGTRHHGRVTGTSKFFAASVLGRSPQGGQELCRRANLRIGGHRKVESCGRKIRMDSPIVLIFMS